MKKSIVHFADFRCSDAENLQGKFTRLLKTAGLADLDLAGKYVAIKMHFGEEGCLAYLRPNWAKTLVDFVKAQGGVLFSPTPTRSTWDGARTRSNISSWPGKTGSRRWRSAAP